MKSLKTRLLGWTIGGMALLVAVFAIGVYMLVHHLVREQFDDTLRVTARSLAVSVTMADNKVVIDLEDTDLPEFRQARHPSYFELWDGDAVLLRSASLAAQGSQELPTFPGRAEKARCYPLTLPSGRAGRIAVLNFEPRPEPANEETTGTDHHDKITPSDADTPEESSEADDAGKGTPLPRHLLTLAVARDTLEMDKDLAALRWLLAGSAAGSVLVMLVVAGLVVRHGLRPLGALAGRIAAIREENLSARIPTGEMPAEMAPVGARLNELLERLDAAFRRERALTADVAHELRTPLGGIQSTIEVTLAQARPPEEYRQALRDCLEIVRQTGGMTANLLSLARLEGGQLPLHPETLRPAELVAALWRPHAASARERGIAFQNQIPPLLACATDREILAIVLANLLANAAEYTGDYGRIEVAGQTQGDTVVMTVRNPGGTLSADDAAHVFDRFWRGDTARSGTGVHCGLGLSLAERAMHVLGGSIAATVTDGTFTATVTLSAREPQNRT